MVFFGPDQSLKTALIETPETLPRLFRTLFGLLGQTARETLSEIPGRGRAGIPTKVLPTVLSRVLSESGAGGEVMWERETVWVRATSSES